MTAKSSEYLEAMTDLSLKALRQADALASDDTDDSGQPTIPSLQVEDWLPGAIGMVVVGIGVWIAWPWLSSVVAGFFGG